MPPAWFQQKEPMNSGANSSAIRRHSPASLFRLFLLLNLCCSVGVYANDRRSPGNDKVVVTNPQHLLVPDQKLRILHGLVREVIVRRLHLKDVPREVPLELVLGQETEQLKLAGAGEPDLIFLKTWDETKFVVSDLQLTIQHLLVNDRWEQMAEEITRRANRISPASKDDVRTEGVPTAPDQTLGDPCSEALRDASVRTTPCAGSPNLLTDYQSITWTMI